MLFARFGRDGLPVDLFNSLPPLGNLAMGCVSRVSMPDQRAPNHVTGPANSAPTMEVHGLAVTHSGVDGVEDPGHLLWTAWNALVNNWTPFISNGRAKATGSLLRNLSIGDQFSRLRRVDEVVDPALSNILSFLAASIGPFAPGYSPAAKPGRVTWKLLGRRRFPLLATLVPGELRIASSPRQLVGKLPLFIQIY